MNAFWAKLKQLLHAIELVGNVALLASGVGAGIEPLVASLEQSVNPALQSIGSGASAGDETMTIYAAAIGVLATLKQTPGLPAAVLSQVEGYLTAAQAGTASYLQAKSGFNPANYTPVTPIA